MIFLKVAPWKCVIWFHKRGKLNPRYIRPYRILDRIGLVSYHLELSRDLEWIHDIFYVSILKKYISDPSHVLKTPPVELREALSFKVQLIWILDHRKKVLRNKVVPIVKVLWRSNKVEEMTWEMEGSMRKHYPCSSIKWVKFWGQNFFKRVEL